VPFDEQTGGRQEGGDKKTEGKRERRRGEELKASQERNSKKSRLKVDGEEDDR
jgi:hypothetical protein